MNSRRAGLTLAAAAALALAACGGNEEPAVATYTVSGTVSGLEAGSTVVLQNNAANDLSIKANGSFSFTAPVVGNSSYAVKVYTQPFATWQSCSVSQGSGTVTANVTSVAVTCTAAQALVSTLAGTGKNGSADGAGATASFNNPTGVTADASGNIYVADTYNDLIRKITPTGVVSTLLINSNLAFSAPFGLALDASGTAYVADTSNHLIRKITPAGLVSTLAGTSKPGTDNGAGTAASFNSPQGVAVDISGNVYVADSDNHWIRKITPAGLVSTLSTGGDLPFDGPSGVAVDASGNVYVADTYNNLIRKITQAGVVTTLAGSDSNGTGNNILFNTPQGIAVDASGNVYVADSENNLIRRITPTGLVSTLAGSGHGGSTNGTGATASFSNPSGLTVDASGNIYVADTNSNMIRKLTPVAAP